MRIIGGRLKGHRFDPPANNWPTRPTTDISKEALYNILSNRIDFEQTRMLDLFGGTGNHCYEFISRGCTDATYVDRYGPALAFVKRMAATWEMTPYLTLVRSEVFRFLRREIDQPYDYVFAGPPYGMPKLGDLPDAILLPGWVRSGGRLVLEHNPRHDFTRYERFEEVRTYGQTHFSFFLAGPIIDGESE